MRWIRSWPAVVPPGRSYVVDDMERLTLTDYDYTPLGGIDEDCCILEWDMAADRLALERFERAIAADPTHVLVAPYKLYTVASEPVWAHRKVDHKGQERWVRLGDETCDYFGFGLIYLPRHIVRAFLEAEAPARGRSPYLLPTQGYTDCRMHDQTFSIWHRHVSGEPPPVIAWDVRPVHLHCN